MNFNIELDLNYDSTKLLVTNKSVLDVDKYVYSIDINFYKYNTSNPSVIDATYSYTIDDPVDLDTIENGLYISFSDINEGLSTLIDGVYNFDISINTALIEDATDVTNNELNIVKCFYQAILKKYTTAHLTYEWTSRYKEDPHELLQIAEESTWIDSLKLAADVLGKIEEFQTLLSKLERYFTLTYDY